MPVEFALRPRIRLRADPAPARRARPRLPKFALPALTYWLVIGGLVYAFVRQHDSQPLPAEAEAALARLPAPASPTVREWWRPLPAKAAPPAPATLSVPPAAELEALPAPISELPTEPAPEAAPSKPPAAEPTPEAPLTKPSSAETEAPFSRALRSQPRPALRPTRAPALASDPAHAPSLDPIPTLDPLAALTSDPAPVPVPALGPAPAPSPAPTSGAGAGAGALPSCEAALASASEDIDFSGGNRAADLPTQAIAAVLENGAWLSSCAVPEHTSLDVCVAIKGGRVVGASVTSRPANAALSACVRRRASSLRFPYSPHVDLARTRF